MANRILILDDDKDFTSLLSDVFSQAGHEVRPFMAVDPALKAIEEESFSLVVTDHNMPFRSGLDFFRTVRESHPELPVVVVSGYLDNDTIRTYINEGARGIFLKPLNIFSLLKKTEAIIEEFAPQTALSAAGGGDAGDDSNGGRLEFPFSSYTCLADDSAEFARRLHSLRTFKANLLLVGPDGVDYLAICRDLAGFSEGGSEGVVEFRPEKGAEAFLARIQALQDEGATLATCFIDNVAGLPETEAELVLQLCRGEGPFADIDLPTRRVFHLTEDLDTLYDQEEIDESLYLFLGTAELRVPPLDDCPEDILPLARRYFRTAAQALGKDETFTWAKDARESLKDRSWTANHAELRGLMERTAHVYTGGEITLALLEAEGGDDLAEEGVQASPIKGPDLERYLRTARDEFVLALHLLTDRSADEAAALLEVDLPLVEEVVSRQPA